MPVTLSVVMGTRNRLHMLKSSIPQIIASGKSINMEIIVNDGGSVDGTVDWLKNISAKNNNIIRVIDEKTDGITAAYNQGFEMASGTYTTWLSDDIIPVGQSLGIMCRFMGTLTPKDMGSFMSRNSTKEPWNVPKIMGFYSPAISCVYTETLKQMNYWNTDFPYYGQDNEFDARLLRRGGSIYVCKSAFADHLNHQDNVKSENLKKYTAQGHGQKFQIIYFHRYGVRSPYEYPVFLFSVSDGTPASTVINTIKNVRGHYKNANYHVEKFDCIGDVEKELDYIKVVGRQGGSWNEFDLIFNISGSKKELFNYQGSPLNTQFGKVLLK